MADSTLLTAQLCRTTRRPAGRAPPDLLGRWQSGPRLAGRVCTAGRPGRRYRAVAHAERVLAGRDGPAAAHVHPRRDAGRAATACGPQTTAITLALAIAETVTVTVTIAFSRAWAAANAPLLALHPRRRHQVEERHAVQRARLQRALLVLFGWLASGTTAARRLHCLHAACTHALGLAELGHGTATTLASLLSMKCSHALRCLPQIQDTRSCVACVGQQNASEVIRRMDFAIASM